MNAMEYSIAAMRTAKVLTPSEAIVHGAMGCGNDIGELVGIIKAWKVYEKPIDMENLIEELGDSCWFINYLCVTLGIQFTYVTSLRVYDDRMVPDMPMDSLALMALAYTGDIALLCYTVSAEALRAGPITQKLAGLYECVDNIADLCGISMNEVFDFNIDKLRRRYPEKYSDEAAIARADKQR